MAAQADDPAPTTSMTTPSTKSKAELLKLIRATAGQNDLLSGTPHLHLAFILRTTIQGLRDKHNPKECLRKLEEIFVKFAHIPDPSVLLISGSSAEGLHLQRTVGRNPDGSFAEKSSDIDLMLVNQTLQILRRPSGDSKVSLVFNSLACHHGYTKIQIIGDPAELPSTFRVEHIDSMSYLSNQQILSEENDQVLQAVSPKEDDKEIRKELGVYSKSSKSRQGPALTSLRSELVSKYPMEFNLDVDTVPAIKTEWPDEARNWHIRKRHTNWPPTELIESSVADGCHVVPVAHSTSICPCVEWRLSFSKAEVMLAHSLSPLQRSCYRLFKRMCSTGISPQKVIASYFLKTTLFWLCEEMPESFWQMHNISHVLIALIDKLLYFLSRRKIPNFFVPENNMVDHIPAEKLETALQSITKIRANPLKYFMTFSKLSVYSVTGIPWHVAFNPVIEDITVYKHCGSLERTMKVFADSLRKCTALQIPNGEHTEALDNFNTFADITEMLTQHQIPHRLAFAALHSTHLSNVLPPATYNCIAFHEHLLSLVSVKEEQAVILYSLGYIYLAQSQIPAPSISNLMGTVLDTFTEGQRECIKEEHLNRAENMSKAQELLVKAKAIMEDCTAKGEHGPATSDDQVPTSIEMSCRLAQVLLLQGRPTEAAECLHKVIRDPQSGKTRISFRSHEKGLYDIDFIMTSIFGVDNDDSLVSDIGLPSDHHQNIKNSKEHHQQLFTVQSDDKNSLSFSERLGKELVLRTTCSVFAHYLLFLVELLRHQRSKGTGQEPNTRGQRAALQELEWLKMAWTPFAGRVLMIKPIAVTLYEDCCLIMTRFPVPK